ncbi:unnamed protein product [Adineta steineri]|uniref:Protein sleepless n=1 Tax=Adineta steineri TaxID=433720 RepID=A0A814W4G5_9BILA|nr:unnamed protein product [Adineta steineri]CAF1470492.1 unnamed protein product [Adineta steineri]
MQRLATSITIFFLVILSFYSTGAIRCYVCRSVDTPDCDSELELTKVNVTIFIVAINASQRCTKDKLSDIYVRGYGDATACPYDGNRCNSSKIADLTVANCCCNTDLCNGVPSIQLQYYLLIPTICVFTVIKKIFTI